MSEAESGTPKARDYMTPTVLTVGADEDLSEVDRLLQKHEVSALVVEDEGGAPVGVISRTDLLRVAVASQGAPGLHTVELPSQAARDVMTGEIHRVGPNAPLSQVAAELASRRIHRLFVEHDAQLLMGVVSTLDVMRACVDQRMTTAIGDAMTPAVVTVRADETMAIAAGRIAEAKTHGLVVVEDGWPVGILTAEEVLLAQHWPAHTAVEEWMLPRVLCLPVGMAVHRAAAHALAMDVRHVLPMDDRGLVGILTPIDFAGAYAQS